MPTFEIPDGPTAVELKRSGNAENPGPATGSVAFSVTNKSAESCTGRLSVVPSGNSKLEWFTVDGDRERTFGAGETQTATITVTTPAATAAGDYPFRLRVVAVNDTDNDHAEGPAVTAKVPAGPVADTGPRIPWWIWVIIGVLGLLIIGLASLFAFGRKPPHVEPVAPMALEAGFDRKGSDFGLVKTPGADECVKLCQAYKPCVAITYVPSQGVCFVKNAVPAQTPNAETISAAKIAR
jgi:hypothetical protein